MVSSLIKTGGFLVRASLLSLMNQGLSGFCTGSSVPVPIPQFGFMFRKDGEIVDFFIYTCIEKKNTEIVINAYVLI